MGTFISPQLPNFQKNIFNMVTLPMQVLFQCALKLSKTTPQYKDFNQKKPKLMLDRNQFWQRGVKCIK